jgi:hypothetical protein
MRCYFFEIEFSFYIYYTPIVNVSEEKREPGILALSVKPVSYFDMADFSPEMVGMAVGSVT